MALLTLTPQQYQDWLKDKPSTDHTIQTTDPTTGKPTDPQYVEGDLGLVGNAAKGLVRPFYNTARAVTGNLTPQEKADIPGFAARQALMLGGDAAGFLIGNPELGAAVGSALNSAGNTPMGEGVDVGNVIKDAGIGAVTGGALNAVGNKIVPAISKVLTPAEDASVGAVSANIAPKVASEISPVENLVKQNEVLGQINKNFEASPTPSSLMNSGNKGVFNDMTHVNPNTGIPGLDTPLEDVAYQNTVKPIVAQNEARIAQNASEIAQAPKVSSAPQSLPSTPEFQSDLAKTISTPDNQLNSNDLKIKNANLQQLQKAGIEAQPYGSLADSKANFDTGAALVTDKAKQLGVNNLDHSGMSQINAGFRSDLSDQIAKTEILPQFQASQPDLTQKVVDNVVKDNPNYVQTDALKSATDNIIKNARDTSTPINDTLPLKTNEWNTIKMSTDGAASDFYKSTPSEKAAIKADPTEFAKVQLNKMAKDALYTSNPALQRAAMGYAVTQSAIDKITDVANKATASGIPGYINMGHVIGSAGQKLQDMNLNRIAASAPTGLSQGVTNAIGDTAKEIGMNNSRQSQAQSPIPDALASEARSQVQDKLDSATQLIKGLTANGTPSATIDNYLQLRGLPTQSQIVATSSATQAIDNLRAAVKNNTSQFGIQNSIPGVNTVMDLTNKSTRDNLNAQISSIVSDVASVTGQSPDSIVKYAPAMTDSPAVIDQKLSNLEQLLAKGIAVNKLNPVAPTVSSIPGIQ